MLIADLTEEHLFIHVCIHSGPSVHAGTPGRPGSRCSPGVHYIYATLNNAFQRRHPQVKAVPRPLDHRKKAIIAHVDLHEE